MLNLEDLATELVLDNEYITMRLLSDLNILYHTIHKPTTEAASREAIMTACQVMTSRGADKWLTDDRKGGPHSPEFIEWADAYWEKHVREAGWKCWAMVVPTDKVSARSLMNGFQKLFDLGVRIQVFTAPEDAFEWLTGL